MRWMDGITAWTLALFAAGTVIATGCYDNVGSLCHLWWVEEDQCPDQILDTPVEPPGILAMTPASVGLDDFTSATCQTYLRKYVWIENLQSCMWLHPDYYLTYYNTAVGDDCP